MNVEFPRPANRPYRPAIRQHAGERLDHLFLAKYTVLRFERAEDFEALLLEHIAAWEPQSRAEEFLILRMAQTAWMLRRIELTEMAVWESYIQSTKQADTEATNTGAIASFLCNDENSVEITFSRRAAAFRAMHEATLDRLTKQLIRVKEHHQLSQIRNEKLLALRREREQSRLSSVAENLRNFSQEIRPQRAVGHA